MFELYLTSIGKVYYLLTLDYWKKRIFDEMVLRTSYGILQALLTLSLEKFKSLKNDHIMIVLTEYLVLHYITYHIFTHSLPFYIFNPPLKDAL
jgi:hypothetical protein